ncbi:MAG: DNA polymerase III subunit beta [Burkholderiales bacterium]|nr:MAG: DNA polymerase III subunit beta [Burkholderiales bacterium]
MHFILSEQREQIALICKQHGVAKLEVFGSAARGVDFDVAQSDADFLVEYRAGTVRGLESYVGLKLALEALLKRPVDLVEPARLRNPYVWADINCAREVVFSA